MTRTRIFWSIYCILVGIALLVKIFFRLEFSGWTMAIAILLLESGVFLLTGSFGLNRFRREEGGGTRAFFNGSIRLDAQSPDLTLVLWHTAADSVVPVENSLDFAQRCADMGVPVSLHVYPFGRHGIGLGDEAEAPGAGTWSALLGKFLHQIGF